MLVLKYSFTHLKLGAWRPGVSPLPGVHRCSEAPSHRQTQIETVTGHARKSQQINMTLEIASKTEISAKNVLF